jgi:ParB family chromosome partitioning protein
MAKAHDEFDDFFGDDDGTPVVDTRADGRLYRVPLGRLAPNLVNPRTDFGTEEELADLGKSLARRQNQPCPAVSRGAYLKLWPDHARTVGDVDYVLVSGERRFRGATAVGLPALNCVVNDDFAADRKTFMEAVVSENVDRQNFNAIEEAYAVQALVAEFGSNRAVAQHFERVDGWVTQRILLTHLAREAQDLVRAKKMPLDAARELGKLARDHGWDGADQLAWWQGEQARRAQASADRAAAKKLRDSPAATSPPAADADEFYGRKTTPSTAVVSGTSSASKEPAVASPPAPTARETPVPVQATASETATGRGDQGATRFPYDDGVSAAHHLIRRMPSTEFDKMLDLLVKHRSGQTVAAR